MELNEEQRKIVSEGDGPVLVVAGPGSGKTRTLVHRVCHMIRDGARPEGILLLTFTNKAAREMKHRAAALIGKDAARITAGTFHHFANMVLRRHGRLIGLDPRFTILDPDDSLSLLKQAALSRHEKVKKGVLDSVMRLISLSKLRMVPLDGLMEGPDFFHLRNHAEDITAIAGEYESMKRAMNVVDFDDLLVLAHLLLQNPQGRAACMYTDILVDEFQDTDRLQAAIIGLLYHEGCNLMAVGDDSQSIYSFRGAEIRNMLEFREKYGAKLFMLVKNYRSTPPIVSLVNGTMGLSRMKIEKSLVAVGAGGSLPTLHEFQDRTGEAEFLVSKIEQELAAGKKVGVLFRAAYLSSELEVALTRKGIPYELRGGVKFFEQRHVKDMLSLLRLYENPRDRPALMRLFTLFPRIGEKGVMRHAASVRDLGGALSALSAIDKSGAHSSLLSGLYGKGGNAAAMLDGFYTGFYKAYMEDAFDDHEERKADIEALIGAAAGFPDVGGFLAAFSLDPEPIPGNERSLVLSTIHQAKGLEWDSVFIMGLADGLLPLSRASDLEEERRLFYVAASRAKSSLTMTYPAMSGRFYDTAFLEPSRFLLELPEGSFIRGGA
jgi:DNA helicase-2/ATP-dependent DNA helicase PcrA